MRFFSTVLALFGAAATLVSAQQPNPITYPVDHPTLQAGQTIEIKWQPTTPGTISLQLRSGPYNALAPGQAIASGVANSGSYSWTIPTSVEQGSYYTIEIISDQNPNQFNYAPQFAISSSNTAALSMTDSITATVMTGSVPTSFMMMTSASTSILTLTTTTSGSSATGSSTTSSTSSTTQGMITAAATAPAGGNGAAGLEIRGWSLGGALVLGALAWL